MVDDVWGFAGYRQWDQDIYSRVQGCDCGWPGSGAERAVDTAIGAADRPRSQPSCPLSPDLLWAASIVDVGGLGPRRHHRRRSPSQRPLGMTSEPAVGRSVSGSGRCRDPVHSTSSASSRPRWRVGLLGQFIVRDWGRLECHRRADRHSVGDRLLHRGRPVFRGWSTARYRTCTPLRCLWPTKPGP